MEVTFASIGSSGTGSLDTTLPRASRTVTTGAYPWEIRYTFASPILSGSLTRMTAFFSGPPPSE